MRSRRKGAARGFSRRQRTKPKTRPGKGEREQSRGGASVKTPAGQLLTGELRLHRDGYGFVLAADGRDLFIPARFVGSAFHTDLVEARIVAEREDKREGRIVRVVERRVTRLMGRLERQGGIFIVVADDRRVHHRIIVKSDYLAGARAGQNVVVRILKYPEGGEPMQGEVIKILGTRGDEETEREAVIARHQLHREFPQAAESEARASRALAADLDLTERRDLRKTVFVTIDGETAKDFDDAVAVERLADGSIRLWVSIADVSYFVRPHTALDAAAYQRGTSVYFPGEAIPMLPETLSNDLCSLRPDEDRLTFTAELDIDLQGNPIRKSFFRSVIRSRERLTYTAVKQVLLERDSKALAQYDTLIPQLELMQECFERLRKRRTERGSIDFDLPEPEILLDIQGDISNIVRAERHVGHMMIEEFMIAANEAVAEFLTSAGAGCVFRVHEPPPPEKLQDFRLLLNNLGYRIRVGDKPLPGTLAQVVKAVRGKPEERLVNHSLLRSMSQAVYSAENIGHYGLASSCYCHFTSPIRRYPDLIVHRLLSQALLKDRGGDHGTRHAPHGSSKARLQEMAEHCSRRERVAMEAEREMAKLFAALFMQDHIDEEYNGIISHVAKFGLYVELIDFFIEGLVPISSLDDDRYIYEERSMTFTGRRKKRSFKVGDSVRIVVEEVDIPNREIVFALV